ncbi:XXYS1_4_G0008280.mRNA.1.CDS.1 [Saccharomyces cerevisiae]|nr:XXYS1_4_G0008280.mRNA.1.CDS.1 [Saccharomyces cerevisiae]
MLRNDEEYKEYLEDIEPYHGDPVGYLKYFSVKRREIYSQIQRNYGWYLAITRRRERISKADQIALGVTASKVPHWTAFLSMLIGLFYNKTFRQRLEYVLEQISEEEGMLEDD